MTTCCLAWIVEDENIYLPSRSEDGNLGHFTFQKMRVDVTSAVVSFTTTQQKLENQSFLLKCSNLLLFSIYNSRGMHIFLFHAS